MNYTTLAALLADRTTTLRSGPVALILIEDSAAIDSTIRHHARLGFRSLVVFCPTGVALPDDLIPMTYRVDYNAAATTLQEIVNMASAALPGQWIYYCYNGEFLFFPFCEHRTIGEMLTFMAEERRDTVMTQVIDLYARDLTKATDAVDLHDAWFDAKGYFSTNRADTTGRPLDRQIAVYGGLRWRFEEHIPYERRHHDRVALFRAAKTLTMDRKGQFSLPEYNTISCPWHHNLTAAICSFRAAKALRRNPGSRSQIATFHWSNSVRFNWESQQLLDLGLMEPGQWF